MSLVEKAKKKAEFDAKKKREEEDAEARSAAYLKNSLAKITRQVLAGLREFHGEKTKYGTIRLVRKQKKPYNKNVAVLRLIRPKEGNVDLLQVDAAIESGTRDYSDDCRNIPYTEAVVSVYVKETVSRSDDRWGYGPFSPNPVVKGLGLKEWFSIYVHNWDDDKSKEKLEEVAEWIAPLFT